MFMLKRQIIREFLPKYMPRMFLQDKDKVAVYQKVIKAFQSDATEKVFNDTFGGYFIKVGWDQDLLASK